MKWTRMKLLKSGGSVVTVFMNADTGMFKGIVNFKNESFHFRAGFVKCCHESKCLLLVGFPVRNYSGLHIGLGIYLSSHNYWIASVQQGNLVSICALCSWLQALSSGMLTCVTLQSSLVRFQSALCCTQCSNHSSAWGPGVKQWCTHYGFSINPKCQWQMDYLCHKYILLISVKFPHML